MKDFYLLEHRTQLEIYQSNLTYFDQLSDECRKALEKSDGDVGRAIESIPADQVTSHYGLLKRVIQNEVNVTLPPSLENAIALSGASEVFNSLPSKKLVDLMERINSLTSSHFEKLSAYKELTELDLAPFYAGRYQIAGPELYPILHQKKIEEARSSLSPELQEALEKFLPAELLKVIPQEGECSQELLAGISPTSDDELREEVKRLRLENSKAVLERDQLDDILTNDKAAELFRAELVKIQGMLQSYKQELKVLKERDKKVEEFLRGIGTLLTPQQ